MKLNEEQNIAFMNDPRRIDAEKKVRGLVHHIQASVKSDCPNADYYLSILPPLINQLSDAYENLSVVEATVEAELLSKERWHG